MVPTKIYTRKHKEKTSYTTYSTLSTPLRNMVMSQCCRKTNFRGLVLKDPYYTNYDPKKCIFPFWASVGQLCTIHFKNINSGENPWVGEVFLTFVWYWLSVTSQRGLLAHTLDKRKHMRNNITKFWK